MSVEITKVLDHSARALERLAMQYKDKPKLAALLGIFTTKVQEIEDALWDVYMLRRLPAPAENLLTSGVLASGSSALTASIKVAPGRLYLVRVTTIRALGLGGSSITVTGAGQTWSTVHKVEGLDGSTCRVDVLACMPTVAGEGQLTIATGGFTAEVTWQVHEWTGLDTSGTNGSGAIASVLASSGTGVTSLAVNATTAGAGTAAVLLGRKLSGTITWSGVDSTADATGKVATAKRVGSVGNVSASFASTSGALIVLILRSASGGFAFGESLNILGRIVGQERENSADDSEYRTRISARVQANRSSGHIEDVLRVFDILLPNATLKMTPYYPAGFVLDATPSVSAALEQVYRQFLEASKAAGVEAQFTYSSGLASGMFTTAVSSFLNGFHGSGSGTLNVDSTAGFPDSGTLVINGTLADGEQVTYTAKTATTFTLSGTTAQAHASNSEVTLANADYLTQGWGDEANSALGGQLASAVAL